MSVTGNINGNVEPDFSRQKCAAHSGPHSTSALLWSKGSCCMSSVLVSLFQSTKLLLPPQTAAAAVLQQFWALTAMFSAQHEASATCCRPCQTPVSTLRCWCSTCQPFRHTPGAAVESVSLQKHHAAAAVKVIRAVWTGTSFYRVAGTREEEAKIDLCA